MLKKAFRWFLIALLVLLVLLLATGVGLYFYIDANRDTFVKDAAEKAGLDLDYGDVTFTAWSTWPHVSVQVDSLVIRDQLRPSSESPFLEAEQLEALFSFDRIWEDTLQFKLLRLNGGALNFLTDSTGTLNLGAFAGARDTTKSKGGGSSPGPLSPVIDWNGVEIALTDFGTNYVDTLKRKRMTNRFDSLLVVADTLTDGDLRFRATVDTHVGGLAFNTDKGSYLRDAGLQGKFTFTRRDTAWLIDTTTVVIGPDRYTIGGYIGKTGNEGIHLYFANPATVYRRAQALLHEDLEEKLNDFDVDGPFPVDVELFSHPKFAGNVKVTIRYSTDRQDVRIKQFRFGTVTTSGTFVNRLPPDEGGTGSRRDFRIETVTTTGYYDGMLVETPKAVIRGKNNEPYLDAPIRLSGGANALSRLFGNTNFFFVRGNFEMETRIDASLMDMEDIISSSDGTLRMRKLAVDYKPAQVRFDFASIFLKKDGEDVSFQLTSGDFPTNLDFGLEGRLDNILPLLLDRPAESLRTEVAFSSDQLNWSGFRELFGQEAFSDVAEENKYKDPDSDAQVQSMKRTLLGLQSTFHPHLTVDVKELGYYDVMKLTDFSSGLHFDGDTMVLEETTFNWKGSELAFDARLDMGAFRQTPFGIAVAADNLNLNQLREPLSTFGLRLPAGIDELPTDLKIRFAHEGVINDTFGIQAGSNVGTLYFNDGIADLFGGTVSYGPKDGVLQTHLELSGDPVFVNDLFAAEDFFFGSGHFQINLDVSGVPENVGELIETANLHLRIDSTNLSYQPAGAYVPIRSFSVDASENHATVDLALTSDATRRSVALRGELEGLTAFLYPENGETFKVKADATASRLHVSDIRTFVRFDDEPAAGDLPAKTTAPPKVAKSDTAAFDPQQILSAGEGIFNSFRPDLSLKIDTFDVDKSTQFRQLHTGISLQDSTLLILEKTGFEMDAGHVELSGTYNIDRRLKSPFTLKWRTDSVVLEQLMLTAKELGLPGVDSMGALRGMLATSGDISGKMDEKRQRLLMNRSEAGVKIKLSPTSLTDWPQLKAMGKKMLMKKRFADVHLAPTQVNLRIDSGVVYVPHTEIQSSPLQLFVKGTIDTVNGPNMLISVPVFNNIGRGVLEKAPPRTGFAHAGWKIFLVMEPDKDGVTKTRFRLGRRKYYKDRGRLAELKRLKAEEKAARQGKR